MQRFLRDDFAQRIHGEADLLLEIEGVRFQDELGRLEFRVVDDVAEQGQEMLAGLENLVQIAGLRARRRLRLQKMRQADHGVERRTQFVAHVRQEGALGDVGDLRRFLGLRQLPGSLRDEIRQLVTVARQLLGHAPLLGDVLRDDDDASHTPVAITDDATA